MISPAAIHTVREHLAKPFDRLALPCAHLVRMNLVLRGNLLQRPVTPKRFPAISCLLPITEKLNIQLGLVLRNTVKMRFLDRNGEPIRGGVAQRSGSATPSVPISVRHFFPTKLD